MTLGAGSRLQATERVGGKAAQAKSGRDDFTGLDIFSPV